MFVQSYRLKNIVKRLLANGQETLDFAALHPAHALRRKAHAETMEFIASRCPRAMSFPSQMDLLGFALSKVTVNGLYLEFGVYRGGSINRIAQKIAPKPVHGFDSFEGLPTDWYNMPKEFFSLGGTLPPVKKNVVLHKGFYDVSLPKWAADNKEPIAFAHIDCDVYTSTKTVLDNIGASFVPGTVLLFDDYFNQPFWREDSHRAVEEYVAHSGTKVDYIAYSYKEMMMVVRGLRKADQTTE
jgi:Methyltransferase domain